MKRVLISGGTGYIGRHVVQALLARGDKVTVFSRRPEQVTAELGSDVRTVAWAPGSRGEGKRAAWFASVAGQDAVVHLAGEQAVGKRFTQQLKQRIYDSRIESTLQLVEAIAEAQPRPSVLLCASAVGYYGGHLTSTAFDEDSAAGEDFLATVTRDWEGAAARAKDYGVRVVSTRFGIVFGRDGGALEQMARPFKLFAGGPIATGKQIVSWVHIEDAVRAIMRCLDDAQIEGPVNVTSPHAVSNEELSRTLGQVLRRPSWARVPEAALRALFGEGAFPIVTGQRAMPAVLQRHGFEWRYPELRPALEEALARG
ncbi:MAG TPA: TIGR01777 family oxidoreductase [Polyangiaceae bacterium]